MQSPFRVLSVLGFFSAAQAFLNSSSQASSQGITQGTTVRQVISQNFPDPSILQVGNIWFSFATNANNTINVQSAATSNVDGSWSLITNYDALPSKNLGTWVNAPKPSVWAPDVIKNDVGQFVMYYSARPAASPSHHCVGVAVSNSIQGPYKSLGTPFACDINAGGAIDASGFQDTNGARYVVYKVDANSNGHGGTCLNTVPPILSTPIMLQAVKGDGYTPIGSPRQILDRSASDGPLVEAPSLIVRNGVYTLFFSSNCFSTPNYDVSYAMSSSLFGPYTKSGPLFITGNYSLYAPGGASIATDGKHLVFHAGPVGSRTMYMADIAIDTINRAITVL